MQLHGLALTVLAVSCGAGAPAIARVPAVEMPIPSERCSGLWIVPLTLEGAGADALRLVLDTGADETSLDPDAVQRVTGAMEIVQVLPGTPAAGADLRAGDRIVAVDGKPLAERGCGPAVDVQERDGVTLTLHRDGEALEVALPITVLVP